MERAVQRKHEDSVEPHPTKGRAPAIVIVDDRITNRNILSRLAATLEADVSVHAFADPGVALDWLNENPADLVVTDYKMPSMDGAEFVRQLRRRPAGFDVPVMVVTVYEDRDFRYRALEAGATDFLLSPVDHHEFRARARNLVTLRRQQQIIKNRAYLLEQRLLLSTRLHEEALRESDQRLHHVIDAVPAMVSATDRLGRYAFINNYQAAFFGLHPNEAYDRTAGELFGAEYGERHHRLDRRVFTGAKSLPGFEETVNDGSGQGRVFLTSKAPLADASGDVAYVVTVSIDITSRKQAERSLAQQKNFLRAVIDNNPSFIFTTDNRGRITLSNEAAAKAFGRSPDRLVGRKMDELVGRADLAGQAAGLDRLVLEQRRPVFVPEQTYVDASGRTIWLQTAKLPISSADGEIDEVLTVATDVTRHMQAEQALREARDAAEFANRTKTAFLGHMSHELRTPLNAIIGFAEVILREFYGPLGHARYREYANDILSSGRHLLTLINEILDVSKIETGRLDLEDEIIDVAGAVHEVLRLVNVRADEGGLRLEARVSDTLPALRADRRRFKQILINLVSNAVKFTPSGGVVRIDGEAAPDGSIRMSVADTGAGIAEKDLPAVLARFGRMETTVADKRAGLGLGLSLATELVKLHGGTLDIISVVGKGTTVTIAFPADRSVYRAQTA